eukprot:CAMPEP_0197656212 /NCGR_PEP_ID=MMETSP1338-20131121/40822_1 /TAXON_ID=43686 ORGANISM="Pelagodinium beii, Strain RCC1491" /NCGR_SAMPLE_ID=MMETSP1338 /ASSEMBLY_ACC=CAM_ASM_000754 /LENGTH=129 /DNA_ID=CAMNT_0043232101 /DNA_START=45 /DNA_END=434 /DNA_ORIENTATION=+
MSFYGMTQAPMGAQPYGSQVGFPQPAGTQAAMMSYNGMPQGGGGYGGYGGQYYGGAQQAPFPYAGAPPSGPMYGQSYGMQNPGYGSGYGAAPGQSYSPGGYYGYGAGANRMGMGQYQGRYGRRRNNACC